MRKNLPLVLAFALIFNLLSSVSFAAGAVDPAKWGEGKTLFKGNCASCHNPKVAQTGPALQGVTARWDAGGDYKGKTGNQWLHTWIRNWSDAVAAGDPYAVGIQNFAPSEMNRFQSLKDEDIDKILMYVENPDFNPGGGGGGEKTANGGGGGLPPAESNNTTLYLLAGLMLVLAGVLVGVTRRLDKVVDEQKGIKAEPKAPFWKSRSFIAASVLIIFVGSLFWLAQNGIRLGRQKGYQPTQPIRFSHQLHAGKHKIVCQYCHTSAGKGKTSGIPSLNTCMNCHKAVTTGPVYGKSEIALIYKAVGWDPDKKVYSGTPKPVEWIRIHNLPDHVYFNHSQHVVAGKVECQTCHGPVQTMSEVYQFAPLSMGWCVNCHRQTEVQFASNNYYSTYEKLHEDLKNKKIDKVTVEKIGGTECAKCHY
ncbi:MAG: cytochrome [Bacteroidetes bacterium]|nr:cytochrome [Bacteroidota bacterium]